MKNTYCTYILSGGTSVVTVLPFAVESGKIIRAWGVLPGGGARGRGSTLLGCAAHRGWSAAACYGSSWFSLLRIACLHNEGDSSACSLGWCGNQNNIGILFRTHCAWKICFLNAGFYNLHGWRARYIEKAVLLLIGNPVLCFSCAGIGHSKFWGGVF